MMGMHADIKEGDRVLGRDDGLVGCTACIHAGRDTMEVWCEDYELFYGFLPATATVDFINMAMMFYRKGEKRGNEQGARDARAAMRAALAD